MQLTPKKVLKYFLQALLIIGVIVALGFLSFTGMLALYGLVGLAIGSFVVTAMIEGEVYAQSIIQGIEKLLKGKWWENKYLKNAIYIRELKKLSADAGNREDSEFLKQYAEHVAALKKLKHQKEKLGLLLFYFFSDKFKQTFENAEKLVQEDQKYFIALMEKDIKARNSHKNKLLISDESKIEENLAGDATLKEDAFYGMRQAILDETAAEITKKSAISPWCLAASVVAGVGMGLVFFSVGPESIVAAAAFFGVALSASAFPVGITVGIAIFAAMAAVGYTVLVYNTLTDMSQNDAVQKWIEKIKQFFSPPDKDLTIGEYAAWVAKKIVSAIAVTLLVGICVFATITTAGTWWYAAKAGITFILPQLAGLAIFLSATAVAIVMGIGQLGFNLYNPLKTVGIIKERFENLNTESVSTFFQSLGEAIKSWFEKAISAIEKKYFDPKENKLQFANPFRFIAIGIALPFLALAFIGHIISSAVMGDRFVQVPVEASVVGGAFVEGISDAPFFHGHSHTDIPGKILFVVLFPVYLLSTLWDFGFSHLNNEHQLSFRDAFIKSFFGFDACKIFLKQESNEGINDGDLKALSIIKISRRLVDPDKSEGLDENHKDFFKGLKENLCNKHQAYMSIFEEADNNEIVKSSEPAKAFLAKVRVS